MIVGGGPVGLTLALDLAWRGIDVTVFERRFPAEPPAPKCNHVSARSMEVYRRLGIARERRNAGLPADYPNDIAYRTAFTGPEFGRIHIPCRRDRYTDKSGPDGYWPTPEPPHRGNQIFLEPILFRHAERQARIKIISRTEVERVEQLGDRVVVQARNLDSGEQRDYVGRYLVGCDGGRSLVRHAIGAELEGDAIVQRVQATFIRAPQLLGPQGFQRAWMTNTVNPRFNGNVIAIDGRERWMVFNYLHPDQADFEAGYRDAAVRGILGVGPEFEYKIISKEDWFGRRLVATRFRRDRVFIAGDAAHIWVPYGGYGMNAGIADVMNLSWLLAAHLNGWASAAILGAYEAERRPITEQVSRFAMAHAEKEIRRRGAVPPEIEHPGPEGDRVRTEMGRLCCEINVHQYCCGGLNFGTYYEASPIIADDGIAHPAFSMSEFTPASVPGCRTPHVWLSDGRSLYDAMGPEFTLLRFDHSVEVEGLVAAAKARGVPLDVLDVRASDGSEPYTTRLVLSRPDQHVAWRGDRVPADALALIDIEDRRACAGRMRQVRPMPWWRAILCGPRPAYSSTSTAVNMAARTDRRNPLFVTATLTTASVFVKVREASEPRPAARGNRSCDRRVQGFGVASPTFIAGTWAPAIIFTSVCLTLPMVTFELPRLRCMNRHATFWSPFSNATANARRSLGARSKKCDRANKLS